MHKPFNSYTSTPGRARGLRGTGISVLISQPTGNIHLTASAYNAPSHFSVPGCFQWPARGQSYAFQESQSPQLLWLSVIAYNLGNLWRRLALPKRVGNWSLTSPQQRLVKTGGRLVKHARYYWLLLAESHLTKRLFGAMLRRIEALPVPSG